MLNVFAIGFAWVVLSLLWFLCMLVRITCLGWLLFGAIACCLCLVVCLCLLFCGCWIG